MNYLNYDELVRFISSQPTEEDKVKVILQYFIDNVEYDYVMIDHINEIVTPRFAKYADLLFPDNNRCRTLRVRNKIIHKNQLYQIILQI